LRPSEPKPRRARQFRPTWEQISKALDVIARDLHRVMENIKAGREWNDGLPPPRPLGKP
jgi:hypothetical protein